MPFVVLFATKRICNELRLKERMEAERERAEEEGRAAEGVA